MNRIIIAGGGVIGLSLAWELSRRGVGVAVYERDRVGQATTHAAGGILPPANSEAADDPIERLRGLSHQLYPDWCERLRTETAIDPQLRRCGGYYLADSAGERASLAGSIGAWRDLRIEIETLTPEELARREPALADWARRGDRSAWFAPDEYQVRPPRLIAALAAACRSGGVEIHEATSAVDLVDGGLRLADGHVARGDAVVLCGGTWTGLMSDRLRLRRSLIPIRGQMLLLRSAEPVIGSIINLGNRYIIPRIDGLTLVGSNEEEAGFELGTDETTLRGLRDFASDLLPKLSHAERIDQWSGLRPMTFDGFPMIGPVPRLPRVWVAAGHHRSGIHLAPGTAVALADRLLGASSSIDLDAFRVGKQQGTSP